MSLSLTNTPSYTPDVAAIRADLEATKAAYHKLLNALSDADLKRPCAVSKWTVKEVMMHLVLGVEQANPMMVKQARQRKPMPAFLNSRLGHWLNYKMAVWGARKATRAELGQRYDAGIANLLTLLDGVQGDEWSLPTAYPDKRPLTMETIFQDPAAHFALHSAWIRQTIRS